MSKPQKLLETSIPDASHELRAVIQEMETATNRIMTAAEIIQKAASDSSGAETAIQEQVTEIFEACTFQDITGQRVNKVVTFLKEMESALSGTGIHTSSSGGNLSASSQIEKEQGLLDGPQTEAPDQADIDKLFNP